jgi:hypothetical protein
LFTSRPKVLPNFLEGSTETLGRAESTETQHWIVSLFDAAVILLDPPIQIGAAAMLDFRTKDLADRTRIRIVAIARHLARNLSDSGDSTTKESLGSRHVARLTKHRVDQIALTINGTVQVAPFSLDLYVRLIDVPAPSNLASTFATQVLGKQRREALFPLPYRFVRKFEAAQQEHFGQVPQAQLITEPAEYHLEYDIGGKLQVIERTTSPLIELSFTLAAAEDSIAEVGSLV